MARKIRAYEYSISPEGKMRKRVINDRPKLIAEYQGRDGRRSIRIWAVDDNVHVTSFDLDRTPCILIHFPETEAQAHRWARRLANVA